MPIPPEPIVREKLTALGAEINSLQVSSDRSVLVYDANYEAHQGPVPDVPAIFVMLCIAGGGTLRQQTTMQDLQAIIEPGMIGIAAPSAPGSGAWPEMRVIGLGIEINALYESFGQEWPRQLRKDMISKVFRDQLVETTMMQIGYARTERLTNNTLLHAAHMVVHQLLDDPFAEVELAVARDSAHPLPLQKIETISAFVESNIDRHIPVGELARLVGVSRDHFSRRFKAATGNTPHQYVMGIKLDRAAASLASGPDQSITDVSQSIGYDNPAQFAKAFRRRFGLAPRIWRTQRR